MTYPKNGNRQTGRTTLMMLNAAIASDMGMKVLVTAANPRQMKALARMLRELGGNLENAYFTTIATPPENICGSQYDVEYRDHYADEIELKAMQDKTTRLEEENLRLQKIVESSRRVLNKMGNLIHDELYTGKPSTARFDFNL